LHRKQTPMSNKSAYTHKQLGLDRRDRQGGRKREIEADREREKETEKEREREGERQRDRDRHTNKEREREGESGHWFRISDPHRSVR